MFCILSQRFFSAVLRMALDGQSWRQGEQEEAVVDCGEEEILKIQIGTNR